MGDAAAAAESAPADLPPRAGEQSKYELQRSQNIRENNEKLVQLGLTPDALTLAPKPSSTTGSKRRATGAPAAAPSRGKSRRVADMGPPLDYREPELGNERRAQGNGRVGRLRTSESSATSPPPPAATITTLTVRQPFASGLVLGHKRVENRTFRAPLGWMGVHAAATLHEDEQLIERLREEWGDDMPVDIADLPRSAVLGFVRVDKVLAHSRAQPHAELADDPQAVGPVCWVIGAFAPLAAPSSASGSQGLWQWAPPSDLRLPEQVLGAVPALAPASMASVLCGGETAALPPTDDGASIVGAAAAAQEAVTAEEAQEAAAEEALLLSAAGAEVRLRVHRSLAFAEIYVLAGKGCTFECDTCDVPAGVGVSIEVVGGSHDARTLVAVTLPLRPVSDCSARFFDCAGRGVWRLRWLLEARRRRARPVRFSPPRQDLN